MKKFLFVLIFIAFAYHSNSQIDKSKLTGNWLKIKTETLDGRDTCGNFGTSNDYMRFSFTQNKLWFARTPYNLDESIDFKFDNDTIITSMHHANSALFETYYFIEKIDDNELVLKTTFKNSDIRYFFKNQNCFKPKITDSVYQFDSDTIVIVRSLLMGPHIYANTPVSNAQAKEIFFPARPIYYGTEGFGYYIGQNLYFREKLKKNTFSKPIQVSFYIDFKGKVSNVQLLEGFQEYYDKQIIDLISNSNKKWIPNIIDNDNYKAKMTFTFFLYDKD